MSNALPRILPGATPQFYQGNTIGCLVVHGFMASPAEVGWLGQHLADEGYTVYVPRLPGHGIDPKDMPRMRWRDWYGHVLDSYHLLEQQCEQIVVIGHSMGGLLSILLASEYAVDALVIAAAPMTVSAPIMPYTRYLSWVMPFRDFLSEHHLTEAIITEQTTRNEPAIGRANYQRWSIRAIHELYQLIQMAPPRLPKITAPTLLLYAEGDETVPISDSEIAKQHLNAQNTTIHTLTRGAHIIFQDVGRDEAFGAVADFITRQLA